MKAKPFILALDQGTTSSRALLFDRQANVVASGQQPLGQSYPRPGWVEQDPEDIWQSQWRAVEQCLRRAGVTGEDIAAIGLTNQRETTVLWDGTTGKSLGPAIVWQCRRSASLCDRLIGEGYAPLFKERTGLVVDPYFSGTKLAWRFDHEEGLRQRAARGEIRFGTVDSWLVHKLTGGRRHLTDASNASRTLLFNIRTGRWDPELLDIFGIPSTVLPDVVDSSAVLSETDPRWFGRPVPIAGIAGDQQAAMFGHRCWQAGQAKSTYGTGSFILMNTGSIPVSSARGLLTTVAWRMDGRPVYALEGSIFNTGAVVQWLRDALGLIDSAPVSETVALSVPDTGGVYFVPAFSGLGAPYWDPYARGAIVGLTRGSHRGHIVRAALESMAYQNRDVLEAMVIDSGQTLAVLRADGGAAANNFVAQFQADILGCPVDRADMVEVTAKGACYLAGLAIGQWSWEELAGIPQSYTRFEPQMTDEAREKRYRGWHRAVGRAMSWIEPTETLS